MSPQEAYQKMRKELGLDSKSGYKDSGVGNGKDPWRGYESGSKGGTDVRNRQGRPVLATEKTLDMALDPETYANTIAEKYGINLRGSGQSITIKYNADLRPGIYGRTTAANRGNVMNDSSSKRLLMANPKSARDMPSISIPALP